MNDADLRQRFDALTGSVPNQPQAYELVRARAGRIRRRRSSAVAGGVVALVAVVAVVPALLRQHTASQPGGGLLPSAVGTPSRSFSGPAPALSGAALAAVRPCTSADLDPGFYVSGSFPDGVARAEIAIANLSNSRCRLQGAVEFKALTSTGAVLAGHPHGVVAPTSVSGVIDIKGAVVVDIGGDQPPAGCTKADLVTPASFVVRIGDVEVTVLNRSLLQSVGQSTAPIPTALTGCSGTIYADSATLH